MFKYLDLMWQMWQLNALEIKVIQINKSKFIGRRENPALDLA